MTRELETNKPATFCAKVISLGRITIPEELRKIHTIEEGDIIELEIRSVQKIGNPKREEA